MLATRTDFFRVIEEKVSFEVNLNEMRLQNAQYLATLCLRLQNLKGNSGQYLASLEWLAKQSYPVCNIYLQRLTQISNSLNDEQLSILLQIGKEEFKDSFLFTSCMYWLEQKGLLNKYGSSICDYIQYSDRKNACELGLSIAFIQDRDWLNAANLKILFNIAEKSRDFCLVKELIYLAKNRSLQQESNLQQLLYNKWAAIENIPSPTYDNTPT